MSVRSRLRGAADWWIEHPAKKYEGEEAAVARTANFYMLIGLIALSGYLVVFLAEGRWRSFAVFLPSVIILVLIRKLLSGVVAVHLLGHVSTAAFAVTFWASTMFVNGQAESMSLHLLYLVPLIAGNTTGRKGTAVWSIVSATAVLSIFIAAEYMPIPPENEQGWIYNLATRGVVLWLFLAFGLVAVREHKRRINELKERRDTIAAQAAVVAERNAQAEAARGRAEELSRHRSAVLADMSRELRKSLTGVMGTVELLRSSESDANRLACLQTIENSGDALLDIMGDVMDMARIEAGLLTISTRPVHLLSLVHGVADLYRGRGEEHETRIVVDIDAEAPQWVMVDPTRLRQVLSNLVSNAVKFTLDGTVTVKVKGSGPIRFEVRDTGIGISPEAKDQLFAAFQQADTSISRTFGGTGLGLWICRRLVDAMGGSIGVESAPGQGSEFWFELDLEPSEASESRGALHAVIPRGTVVAVVDDDQTCRSVAAAHLRQMGIIARTYRAGAEFLDDVRDGIGIDAVLMDLYLHEMSGSDIAAAFAALRPNVPVIAVTAAVLQEDEIAAREAGMVGFVAKPFANDTLRTAIADALDLTRRAGSAR